MTHLDGKTLRHRRLGYTVTAHARPYGLLLIADDGNHLRNWTARHEDAAELEREFITETTE